MDDRQLTVVSAKKVGAQWELSTKTSQPVEDGLYLMLPIDDLAHSVQIALALHAGMKLRGAVE